MPRLPNRMADLRSGLRKLLNFLLCLSPSPSAPQVQPPVNLYHEDVTPAVHAPQTNSTAAAALSSPQTARSRNDSPAASHIRDGPSKDAQEFDNGAHMSDSIPESVPGAAAAVGIRETSETQALALGELVHSAKVARADAHVIGERPANTVQLADDAAPAADEWSERIDNLLSQISKFSDVVSVIGELHPYVRIVTGIIRAGIDPILKQKARDDAMQKLIESMSDAYDVVMKDHALLKAANDDKDDPRCKLLARLAQQTAECAMFIREHYDTKSFLKRAVKTIPKHVVDEQLCNYSSAFVELGRKIAEWDISVTKDIVSTISTGVSNIDRQLTLQELFYAEGTGWHADKLCLTGTRTATLDILTDWVVNPDTTRAMFVVGMAGSGKSSIAHSIASRFQALGRLAGFFAFNRADARLRPWSVFSTLARELANRNADFKHALHQVLREKGHLAKSSNVIEQWDELIVGPSSRVHYVGPVLIVVDAFDECTDLTGPAAEFDRPNQDLERGRKNLLDCLTKRVGELPVNFRLLITSRFEPDVQAALDDNRTSSGKESAGPAFDYMNLGWKEHDPAESIHRYVRHELDSLLNERQIQVIVSAADGLFEWAATACRRLKSRTGGTTLAERFSVLFEGPSGSSTVAAGSLEHLYARILSYQFSDEPARRRFRAVLAHVLYAAEPISMRTLKDFYRASGKDDCEVDLILPYLGSLLSGVGDSDRGHTLPIRPLHTSFRDYLTKVHPFHAWHVDSGDGHNIVALGVLCILNRSLHFNICNFPSSYVLNKELTDLADRVKKIPVSLMYAIRYWSDHISMSLDSDRLRIELRTFVTEKLLFWLEMASLCGLIDRAGPALRITARFVQGWNDTSLIEFVNDAILFVGNFIEPMHVSVPHIYLSALAFCPITSRIRQHFIRDHDFLPTVNDLAVDWPQAQNLVLRMHGAVSGIACSPNGRHVVLGGPFSCGVRIVDAENMHETVRTLAYGGRERVCVCVACSPDGRIIVAGFENGDICQWDASTGDRLDLSNDHSRRRMLSLCFTHDGRFIISAFARGVMRWDTQTGEQVVWDCREVTGATCSMDGRSIIVTAGRSMAILDEDRGRKNGPHIHWGNSGKAIFCSESLSLGAISRSPQCDLIAVGTIASYGSHANFDTPIYVFSLDKRAIVGKPMHGHRGTITNISWSPDGQLIASASMDNTIRLWRCGPDGDIFPVGPIYGHTKDVRAVGFSSDGQFLISGAWDYTLRTWNVAAALVRSDEPTGQAVAAVAFCPHAPVVAAIFHGGTGIYMWNSDTGASISYGSPEVPSADWLKEWLKTAVRRQKRVMHREEICGAAEAYSWVDIPMDAYEDDSVSRHRYHLQIHWQKKTGSMFEVVEPGSHIPVGPSLPTGHSGSDAYSFGASEVSPSGHQILFGRKDGNIRILDMKQVADSTQSPAIDSAFGRGSHQPDVPAPFLDDDGWFRDGEKRPIIYVPESYRSRLWSPGLRHILLPNRGPVTPIKIDGSRVGLGEDWTQCYKALNVAGNVPAEDSSLFYKPE